MNEEIKNHKELTEISEEKSWVKRNWGIILIIIGFIVLIVWTYFAFFSTTGEVVKEPQRELSILQWDHFVPGYDVWFDEFVKQWGEDNGVNVTIDHINIAEIRGRTAAEIELGEGHDLYEHLAPPANFELDMMDLTELNKEAEKRFGEQASVCKKSSFNPVTNKFYGFCHGWIPDPGNYRKSLWELVDKPEGPNTWGDLLEFGTRINKELGVGMGIGMSKEIDSNMALRALMWSYGASVQNENGQVVINSPATIEAVEFMAELYTNTMTDEVFDWQASSNNQALIAAKASYILNSISAYRTAQKAIEKVADDVFFVPPLSGSNGKGVASAHVLGIYTIPKFSKNSDTAEEFLLYLVENYDQAVLNSELYNFPGFPSTAPELMESGGWLDDDPFDSNPADKLFPLKDAESWTVNVGYPGPANAAIGEVFDSFIIPNMFAKAIKREKTPEEAVAEAEVLINEIFRKWKDKGLVGPNNI